MRKLATLILFAVSSASAQHVIGCIGDSLTNAYTSIGPDECTRTAAILSTFTGQTWTADDQGENGTTTHDWLSTGTSLPTVVTDFTSHNVNYVLLMLGTNDSSTANNFSASTYSSNLSNIFTYLEAHGFNKIMVSFSPYLDPLATGWSSASIVLLQQYQTVIRTLVAASPGVLFLGDTQMFPFLDANLSCVALSVHPCNYAYNTMAQLWAEAFEQNFLGPTVYLRDGPAANPHPAVQYTAVSNYASGAPVQVTAPLGHGFSNTCGTSKTCYVFVSQATSDLNSGVCPVGGVTVGTVGIDFPSDTYSALYVDAYNLKLYDRTGVSVTTHLGNPIAPTGNYCNGQSFFITPVLSWLSEVSPYTLGSQPLGWLDGPNGNHMHELSTGPLNGLMSLVVSGCSGGANCVATVTTSYDPAAMPIPVAAGQGFSITGTGTSLDNCGPVAGTGSRFSQYSIASTFSSAPLYGWMSNPFSCSGLTNGTYTGVKLTCGPSATPNDTIGGIQDCVRVSLLGFTGNPIWDRSLADQAYYPFYSPTGYKFIFDGGTIGPMGGVFPLEVLEVAPLVFLVDQSNQQLLNALSYYMDNVEEVGAGNWITDWSNSTANGIFLQTAEIQSGVFGDFYAITKPYRAISRPPVYLNKILNNVETACSPSGVIAVNNTSNTYTIKSGHTTAVAGPATARATSSTTITLASADVSASCSTYTANAYCNNVIKISGTGAWCLVTGYVSSTKVATCSGGWQSGSTPASNAQYTVYATAASSMTTPSAQLFNGTATGGGTNTITLQAGDTATPGQAIFLGTGPTQNFAIVQSFNSATGVATMATSWTSAPTTGIAYTRMSTSTITGYNTHFTGYSLGDGIQVGQSGVPSGYYMANQQDSVQIIVGIASDTSMTVINGAQAGAIQAALE